MDMAVIVEHDRAQRALAVENCLATVRLEGLEPSEASRVLYQRFVDGEITEGELDIAMAELLDRDYGSIRLPRNERP
jgi:hypothetical protein